MSAATHRPEESTKHQQQIVRIMSAHAETEALMEDFLQQRLKVLFHFLGVEGHGSEEDFEDLEDREWHVVAGLGQLGKAGHADVQHGGGGDTGVAGIGDEAVEYGRQNLLQLLVLHPMGQKKQQSLFNKE